MAKTPRQERNERLDGSSGGVMGSSSADLIRLVRLLYEQSARYAQRYDGNVSPFPIAAIPILFSAARCFVIEYEFLPPTNAAALNVLKGPGDFREILKRYNIKKPLAHQAKLLWEIRNEIVHPVHTPTGTKDNWPDSLREIKEMGILQSTNSPDHDYIMMAQLESHRLFGFACGVIRDVVATIISSDSKKQSRYQPFLRSYDFGFDDPREK